MSRSGKALETVEGQTLEPTKAPRVKADNEAPARELSHQQPRGQPAPGQRGKELTARGSVTKITVGTAVGGAIIMETAPIAVVVAVEVTVIAELVRAEDLRLDEAGHNTGNYTSDTTAGLR
jgi:hypothetical protein